MKANKYFITVLFLFYCLANVFAQCSVSSGPSGSCSGCDAASGDNINNSASTKCYSSSDTFATYTVSKGSLRVCVTLTITSLSLGAVTGSDSIVIVVESGGSLTISNSVSIDTKIKFRNRGTMRFSSAVTTNNSGFIVNEIPSAKMYFTDLTVSGTGSNLVNRGQIYLT